MVSLPYIRNYYLVQPPPLSFKFLFSKRNVASSVERQRYDKIALLIRSCIYANLLTNRLELESKEIQLRNTGETSKFYLP